MHQNPISFRPAADAGGPAIAGRFSALGVAQRLYKLSMSHAHYVQATQRLALVFSPPQSPSGDNPLAYDEDFFMIETQISARSYALPQLQARRPTDMSRAIGRRLRIFDHAVVGNQSHQRLRIVSPE